METQKKFKIVPFEVEHLDVMDLRPDELEDVMALDDWFDRFTHLKDASIEAKTFSYDGRIIFCAGFMEFFPGVIDCWMMPSIHVNTAKLQFCRVLKAYVDDIIKEYKCHRFQTNAPNDELHARWMKFLGLEKEGVMKKFTHNKQDSCMYAKVM